MVRLNDTEYNKLFNEIEQATELTDDLVLKLNNIHMECDARNLEYSMGKRSAQSVKRRKMIDATHALETRFNRCLVYRNGKVGTIEGYYEIHEAGYNHWDWVGK